MKGSLWLLGQLFTCCASAPGHPSKNCPMIMKTAFPKGEGIYKLCFADYLASQGTIILLPMGDTRRRSKEGRRGEMLPSYSSSYQGYLLSTAEHYSPASQHFGHLQYTSYVLSLERRRYLCQLTLLPLIVFH